MPLNISYMGTKRRLAASVAKIVALAPEGPMLDLFSGMCAVASAVTPTRPIWCNDVQFFAEEVSKAFFGSTDGPRISVSLTTKIREEYVQNRRALRARFAAKRLAEAEALDSKNARLIAKVDASAPNIGTSRILESERKTLLQAPRSFPYRMFTMTFSGAYFGLEQSIEIDSVRYAIDRLLSRGVIGLEQHRWMLLALCQAACKTANTTGHFAQFLKVKPSNVSRFVRQRRRSILDEWLGAIRGLSPLGSQAWRKRNRTFRTDAISLLSHLRKEDLKPAVIYADPPYTGDHYSRYYHVYESLVRYDYPPSSGIGRYRPDRFQSAFSLKSRIADEIERLAELSSAIGAELVLSYPQNGLLNNSTKAIPSILSKYYSRHEVFEIAHFHSSLGGSKGIERHPVVEMIYRAH
jgi:adenine-specific DNA-methyltransferase